MDSVFQMMNFVLKLMDSVFQMMNFVFQMMDSVFQMMNFVFQMMNLNANVRPGRRMTPQSLLRYWMGTVR